MFADNHESLLHLLADIRYAFYDGGPQRYWPVRSLNELASAVEGFALGVYLNTNSWLAEQDQTFLQQFGRWMSEKHDTKSDNWFESLDELCVADSENQPGKQITSAYEFFDQFFAESGLAWGRWESPSAIEQPKVPIDTSVPKQFIASLAAKGVVYAKFKMLNDEGFSMSNAQSPSLSSSENISREELLQVLRPLLQYGVRSGEVETCNGTIIIFTKFDLGEPDATVGRGGVETSLRSDRFLILLLAVFKELARVRLQNATIDSLHVFLRSLELDTGACCYPTYESPFFSDLGIWLRTQNDLGSGGHTWFSYLSFVCQTCGDRSVTFAYQLIDQYLFQRGTNFPEIPVSFFKGDASKPPISSSTKDEIDSPIYIERLVHCKS